MSNKKKIYSTEHPSYIRLSAVLDYHGLMGDKEDVLIQDILNTLMNKQSVQDHTAMTDHGIDIVGDEWEY